MRGLLWPTAAHAQLPFLTVLSVVFHPPFAERRVIKSTKPEHQQFRMDRHDTSLRD